MQQEGCERILTGLLAAAYARAGRFIVTHILISTLAIMKPWSNMALVECWAGGCVPRQSAHHLYA